MLIFKANKVDYKEKILKSLFIITAAAVLTAYLSGVYLKKIERDINQEINNYSQQLKKYQYLIMQNNSSDSDLLTYQFLKKIIIYAENIRLENLYIDKKEITIYAEAEKKEYIFEFLQKIKNDDMFLKAEVNKIEINEIFNFAIRADLISR